MASTLTAAAQTWTPEALQRLWAAARQANPALPAAPPPGWNPNLGIRPWQPWSSSPPTGSYDPSLDAARNAADRGYGDLQSDTGRQDLRDTVDYGLGRESITRGRDRSLADLGSSLGRGTEDYGRNIAMLKRAYAVKGNQQTERANAYGVLSGGALMQAAAKRAANEAIDQQPIDTSFARFKADNALGVSRTNEDATLALGDLALRMAPPDAGNPLGGRSFQDRATALTRAGRENVQFGIDTEAQKAFQAAGTGWDPGTRPRGEYLDPSGKPYRVKVVGGIKYRVDPSGHVISSVRRRRR